MLVVWELPVESQFPSITPDLPEAAKYASLWAMKDANWIHDNKIFWVFMEMNLRMGINRKPWLSPTVYNSLQSFADIKSDFHHKYLRACKDLARN